MLFFAAMIFAGLLAGQEYLVSKTPQIIEQAIMLAPYVLAALAMFFTARWAYLYCAFMLFACPAFLAYQAAILLVGTDAPMIQIAPLLAAIGLLFWLFYAYSFGRNSRKFYADKQLNFA